MRDDSHKRWALYSAKPAGDGRQKQLSDGWMLVWALIAAVLTKQHRTTGIETLLLGKPRLVRQAAEILRKKKYILKRAAIRECYDKPKGSVICARDYRIAVANAARVYAEAVEAWLASRGSASELVAMPDVWQWIADQATNRLSHLSIRLRATGHIELADAELDRSEGWWRNQLAKTSAFLLLKHSLKSI